jgi:Transposase domain (DUF772)
VPERGLYGCAVRVTAWLWVVKTGRALDDVLLLVGDRLPEGSIYRLLAEHGAALFGDEYFVDLFQRSTLGRPTVPARVVATVRLLQAYEGLSDREACDRLAFDLRWKAAAGLTVDAAAFQPTTLVRLRASRRPRRLFDDVNATASGLLRGRRRVLDSTPVFDAVAVATRDTVIQLRAAIRRVLSVAERADPALADAVRAVLTREDDYASLGKPPCDWDDPKGSDALVDALVKDTVAVLAVLDGHELAGSLLRGRERKSDETLRSYRRSIETFLRFCDDTGVPRELKASVIAWLDAQHDRETPRSGCGSPRSSCSPAGSAPRRVQRRGNPNLRRPRPNRWPPIRQRARVGSLRTQTCLICGSC